MATTGFFNPLTGFSLMFPRPLDEAAARERLLTDRREGRASQERIADQNFAAKIAQLMSSEQSEGKRLDVLKEVEKYKADKAVEAARGRWANVSAAILRQISNDADRAEAYANREMKAWSSIDAWAKKINSFMASSGDAQTIPWGKRSWFGKRTESKDEIESRKKLLWGQIQSEVPKNIRQFLDFDDKSMTVMNAADKPEPFNRLQYIRNKMDESGIDFRDLKDFGAELGSSPTDANNTTSPGPVKGGRGSAPSPFSPGIDDVIPSPITHAPGVAPSGDEDQSFIGALNRADDLTSGRANIPFGQAENLGTIVRIGNNVVLVGQDGSIQPISSGFGRALGLGFGNTFSPGAGAGPTVSPFGQ